MSPAPFAAALLGGARLSAVEERREAGRIIVKTAPGGRFGGLNW
jgi:hypothetical protein